MSRYYKRAIDWIAHNDAPGDDADTDTLAGYLTVLLVANIFGREPAEVAQDVACEREHIDWSQL